MITRPAALIFDVNETLLDLSHARHTIAAALSSDESLVDTWFATLLHHSLVESAIGSYHSFTDIGAAALVMVAHSQHISLSSKRAHEIVSSAMTSLPPHDDVVEGLETLTQEGFTLAALSNSPAEGLNRQLTNAGIARYFPHIMSVESTQMYKPHEKVYAWATQHIGQSPHNCMMVAAHGWDVAGASAAGLQTAFVGRPGKCAYPLAAEPTLSVSDLNALAARLRD